MLRFCSLNLRIMEKVVEVREARRDDCQEIRKLIQELADFAEMPDGPKIDYKVLEKNGFDVENPLFKCYVAVCDEKIVGYALYFYVYTTLDRRAMHLEDLYVTPEFRKKHIGSRLFDSVAKKVFDEKCQYLEFSVLSWNPAQHFYKAKGAVDLTEAEGWHAFRVKNESLLNLASKSSGDSSYIVRKATSDDFESIRRLAEDAYSSQYIRISKYKKPNFDKISVITVDETINDTRKTKYYGYLVVEQNVRVVGYALYCYSYSTWEGRSVFLQELYVSPNGHHANMKLDLFSAIAKKTSDKSCSRLDFWVLDHTNEMEFYTTNGAVDLTESEEWRMYRLFELAEKPI